MASITINPVHATISSISSVSGDEKFLVINKGGKPSTIGVNQILDTLDDEIEESIADALENADADFNLKWNEIV